MAKSDSPLVDAAAAFDAELATYSRLGELFLKTPLNTLKHLQRAQETLGEIASSEERLQAAGSALVQALSAARTEQEQLSQRVIEHAPNIRARGEVLRSLMDTMGELARDATQLNAEVTGKNGETQAESAAPADASPRVFELSERAEALSTKCREADFDELAEQVHALYQRLKALATKLQKAGGN